MGCVILAAGLYCLTSYDEIAACPERIDRVLQEPCVNPPLLGMAVIKAWQQDSMTKVRSLKSRARWASPAPAWATASGQCARPAAPKRKAKVEAPMWARPAPQGATTVPRPESQSCSKCAAPAWSRPALPTQAVRADSMGSALSWMYPQLSQSATSKSDCPMWAKPPLPKG